MFEKAIQIATEFTRPIHTISRTYGSKEIEPGCATLFFINADGWALTCKHVAKQVFDSDAVNLHYANYKKELAGLSQIKKKRADLPTLKKKYSFTSKHTVEIKNLFINCIEGPLNARIFLHPDVDLALIKFSDFTQLHCKQFPIFPLNTVALASGKSLCRLGYPFPEFDNFSYNDIKDEIEWTAVGRQATPQFPLDGMVTRFLIGTINGSDGIIGFEMSTPGLRGQSGGPAFDVDGKVWGVQSATNHLYLGFDVKKNVKKGGKKVTVSDSAFLHVGHVIHVDVIKSFMRQNSVAFQEV